MSDTQHLANSDNSDEISVCEVSPEESKHFNFSGIAEPKSYDLIMKYRGKGHKTKGAKLFCAYNRSKSQEKEGDVEVLGYFMVKEQTSSGKYSWSETNIKNVIFQIYAPNAGIFKALIKYAVEEINKNAAENQDDLSQTETGTRFKPYILEIQLDEGLSNDPCSTDVYNKQMLEFLKEIAPFKTSLVKGKENDPHYAAKNKRGLARVANSDTVVFTYDASCSINEKDLPNSPSTSHLKHVAKKQRTEGPSL